MFINGESVDFGTYPANQPKTHSFLMVNRGKTICHFGKIRSTCGCSETRLDKTSLKPGEPANLLVTVKENSISGPYSKAVYVETDMPGQRFIRLTLNGNAIPLVKVEPNPLLYLGVLTPDQTYQYQFTLSANQPRVQLELEKSSANQPGKAKLLQQGKHWLLKVEIQPLQRKQYLNLEWQVKVTSPQGWPPIVFKLHGRTAQ